MRKFLLVLTCLLCILTLNSQELNALVSINSDKVQSTNKQVYSTLKNAITEFLNQTKWTNKNIKPQERINCAFNIIINTQDVNIFTASLQIQSTRPVFGSTYETPIINYNDTRFNFEYNEFNPLLYNPTRYDNNLISTLVFYVYVILGADADTFALKGGDPYLKQAQNIMLLAQQSGFTAWENRIGELNRFTLIDNYLSPKFSEIRSINYNYHRKGLDVFSKSEIQAKQQIETNVMHLNKLYNVSVGNFVIRTFLDAKSDEIVNIFTDGKPSRNQNRMIEILQKISPLNRNKWKKIN